MRTQGWIELTCDWLCVLLMNLVLNWWICFDLERVFNVLSLLHKPKRPVEGRNPDLKSLINLKNHKVPLAHKLQFLAPETEPFCQFLAPEILVTHFDDFWAQKLTFLDCFWPQKLNHFVSFWLQKLFWPIFTISGARNWTFLTVSGARNLPIFTISGSNIEMLWMEDMCTQVCKKLQNCVG